MLPENKKKETAINTTPDMWLYSDSYVGKSTFIDSLNDLLFINTDGNVENLTSPCYLLKDEITIEGRLTKRKFAWSVFLDVIAELERKENTYKVIALDLVEDLWEHCRLYMYDKLDIEHEQDAGFGKGWDMVRTEFLSNIKRLKNLGYRIVYISKEATSEVTLKNGTKLTTYFPNINAKVANVLTGTVTLTIRAFMDGNERYLQLAKKENIFGGGRFNFVNEKCALDMGEFVQELKAAQSAKKRPVNLAAMDSEQMEEVAQEMVKELKEQQQPELETADSPPRRRRRE